MEPFVKLPGRFLRIDPSEMTPAQQSVVNEVMATRGSLRGKAYSFRGAFYPVLQNPELLSVVQKLGEYLRFGSHLPQDLVELAILITIRLWNCGYAWGGHAPNALEHGLAKDVVDAVAKLERPANMSERVAAVHDFAIALHKDKSVSDQLFSEARRHVGEQGLLDLIAICGYYSLVGMIIAVDKTPVPPGRTAPF